MLTPTDVHYLVGIFSFISGPENVDVELGARVFDVAAEEDRDVDVTVTSKQEDLVIRAASGIEVKKHSRPLTVEHVEQLCLKLNHMPTLNERSIVSASGFTKGAVKKAAHENVELYEIKDWSPQNAVGQMMFAPNFKMEEGTLHWLQGPTIWFNPGEKKAEIVRSAERNNCSVMTSAGAAMPGFPNLKTLGEGLASTIIGDRLKESPPDTPVQIDELFALDGEPHLVLSDGSLHPLRTARMWGTAIKRIRSVTPEFTVL